MTATVLGWRLKRLKCHEQDSRHNLLAPFYRCEKAWQTSGLGSMKLKQPHELYGGQLHSATFLQAFTHLALQSDDSHMHAQTTVLCSYRHKSQNLHMPLWPTVCKVLRLEQFLGDHHRLNFHTGSCDQGFNVSYLTNTEDGRLLNGKNIYKLRFCVVAILTVMDHLHM